jgi:hypothetical protein
MNVSRKIRPHLHPKLATTVSESISILTIMAHLFLIWKQLITPIGAGIKPGTGRK